jgi:uncharacterized protein YbjT (DUF2867 family)
MRIAITGGTGFVGGHFAQRLIQQGHEAVLVARRQREALPANVRFAASDLTNIEVLAAPLQDVTQSLIAPASIVKPATKPIGAYTSMPLETS